MQGLAEYSDFRPKNGHGAYTLTKQDVAPASDLEVKIPLEGGGWKSGKFHFYIPTSVATKATHKRMPISMFFGREDDDAQGTAGQVFNITVSSHFWNTIVGKGWRFADDSWLSTTSFATGSGQIRIKKARIISESSQYDTLLVVFTNTHGSITAQAGGEFVYRVSR